MTIVDRRSERDPEYTLYTRRCSIHCRSASSDSGASHLTGRPNICLAEAGVKMSLSQVEKVEAGTWNREVEYEDV